MVKTALKVYKNNIWHFFTILGFVALGVIIGISILLPAVSKAITDSANEINAACTKASIDHFNFDSFFKSIYDQFKAMDWSNPFETLKIVFTQNKIVEILTIATNKAGVNVEDIKAIWPAINSSAKTIVDTSVNQFVVLISCISICSIVGYVLIRTVIHFKTTKNRNIFRYIINTAANVIFMSFIFYLIVITMQSAKGVGLAFALIGIILLLTIGILSLSFVSFAQKGVKFLDIVNIKTIILSIVSDLIIIALSFTVIAIIFPFNALAAILIAIPLLIITTIIMDSTTNAFVNNFSNEELKMK